VGGWVNDSPGAVLGRLLPTIPVTGAGRTVGSPGCVGEGQRPSPPLLTPPSSPIRELGGGRWVGGGSMTVQGAVPCWVACC
jgi:hypothetical protein